MSKKIASEFSIGLILLMAIVIGGIVLLENRKQEMESNYIAQQDFAKQPNKTVESKLSSDPVQSCSPHYYNGEAIVQGWLANPAEINNDQLTIKLNNQDIQKLPVKFQDSLQTNSTAILIDPTESNRQDLKDATEENPANLTVHGYATLCEPFSRISNQQATIAFKKAKS